MNIGITCLFDANVHNTWKRIVPVGVDLVDPRTDCCLVLVVNAPHASHADLVRDWVRKGRPLIVCQMEPNMHTWGDWANPWMTNPITVFEHTLCSGNVMEWFRPENVEELLAMEPLYKTRDLSMILSRKNADPGHIVRNKTCRVLQKMMPFDLFGTIEGGIPLPINLDKRDGTDSYRYHVTAENHKLDNYVTEKMYDGLLAGCVTFWWGGVQNIVKPDCFVRLFDDEQTNANLIKLCVRAKVYDKMKGKIWDEKNRLLKEWNLGNRILVASAGHV